MILAVLSYLLYDDSLLFPRAKNGNLVAVGSLSTLENDVRRKSSTDFVWLPGIKKDEVYNQDSIFTGNNSRATVQMNDGSIIEIQENSLVNINVKDGQMQLDLRFGQLTGTGKSTIKVKTTNDEYTIDGKDGRFQVNRSSGGDLGVKVLSGKAEIKGKKGRQDLKSNESFQISDKGVEKNQVEATIQLITKDNNSFQLKKQKDPVPLEWSSKGPVAQYQVEISTDENFKTTKSLKFVTEPRLNFTDALNEGSYFWRVKGLDNVRKLLVTSKAQRFQVRYLAPPTIVSPANASTVNAVALISGEGLKSNFKLSWENDERLVKYQWQLSHTADFQAIISDSTQTEKTIQTPSLESGEYFSRVRGFDKDGNSSEWSSTHTVRLNIEGEVKPPAPKLVNLEIRFQKPVLQGRTPSAAESPKLEWHPVKAAKNYHWEIAENSRFAGARALDTTDTKVAWQQYTPGKHFYRVYARSELGQLSAPSETGTLHVLGSAPQLSPIAPVVFKETNPQATAPLKTTPIAWSPIEGATAYSVQIATNPEFSNPVEKQVAATQMPLELGAPGKYFVRVKATNATNEDISEYSNVETAEYIFKITLKKPMLIEPINKTTLFLQKKTEPYVWLEWDSVPGALKYKLEISQTADFSELKVNETLTETRYFIKTQISYGNIYWRVKALPADESFASEWAAWQFSLLQQRNQGF